MRFKYFYNIYKFDKHNEQFICVTCQIINKLTLYIYKFQILCNYLQKQKLNIKLK